MPHTTLINVRLAWMTWVWTIVLTATQCPSVSIGVEPRTRIAIVGEAFHINGQPTYAGRSWNGKTIEGLLLNSRMVQATFDDLNPQTRDIWAYPDTKTWDADRNLREFLAARDFPLTVSAFDTFAPDSPENQR